MIRFSMDWSELSLQLMIAFAHFLWQACVVGLILFIAQRVVESLRGSLIFQLFRVSKKRVSLGKTDLLETDLRGANIRYMIACTAFFSLPICLIATFAWVHQSRGPIVLVASDPVESPMAAANEAAPTMANSDIHVLSAQATGMEVEALATEPIEASTLMVKPKTSPVHRIQTFAPFLMLAYIVGVCFMLARFVLSIIGSSRLRRTIQPITELRLLQTIAEQCARIGLNRVPLVALCQRVSVPVVVGIVKPMILLPPTLLCGLDPNQIAAILSHEMAHIRRYDLVVNLLQRVVEALLFFHPVTWWISRRISIERENCCDDIAAAGMGRLSYAGALLQMAELCIGKDRPRSEALAALSATGSHSTDFGYRIRRLIGTEETTRVGLSRRSVAIGLILLMVSLVAWGQNVKSPDAKLKDESMSSIFTPEPLWQTKVAASEIAAEMTRVSPVAVVSNRVLTIGKDFDLTTGKEIQNPFVGLPRKYGFGVTLEPTSRRKSLDRKYIVEVSNRGPGETSSEPSTDVRVLRASDGSQVGASIFLDSYFDANSCDVDVLNGGRFRIPWTDGCSTSRTISATPSCSNDHP